MKEVYFIVEGKVQPKQRPRIYRNKNGIHTVTPKKTIEYECKVRSAYIEACENTLFIGAVEIVLNVYVQIPKSTPKKERTSMSLGLIRPTVRNGDVDNMLKSIADALNGIAYKDDSQIVTATVRKFYAEKARAEITLREVENEN